MTVQAHTATGPEGGATTITSPSGERARGRYGVLLMTYGSPSTLDEVPTYLANVRGGRPAPDELVTEFRRRYEVIGGSPLIGIARQQAAALEGLLQGEATVRTGMRFSAPTVADGLRELAATGCERVVGIILSPQYSPLLMGGYQRAVDAALDDASVTAGRRPEVRITGAWHREPAFLDALAARVRRALERFPAEQRGVLPVLMTAHSLPRRVAEQEPDYLAQLEETATAVAERAGLSDGQWRFCWQSAGHEPGEWMKPDFADLMPQLHEEGHRSVLVVPVQFFADHLEVLYDIDIGAREQADDAGMSFGRIDMLNADPELIDAFASIVRRELGAIATAA